MSTECGGISYDCLDWLHMFTLDGFGKEQTVRVFRNLCRYLYRNVRIYVGVLDIFLYIFYNLGQFTCLLVLSLWTVLTWRRDECIKVEVEGVCPSVAACLGVEFPPGHSSGEAEVSGETQLSPDRLGLPQWLMHNSSTQHWGKDFESITATTTDPSFSVSVSFSLPLSLS